jgi:hypothetical protein
VRRAAARSVRVAARGAGDIARMTAIVVVREC